MSLPLLSALLVPLVSVFLGCGANEIKGVQRVKFAELQPPPPGPVPSEPYRIQRGDGLAIKFVNNPELNVEGPVGPGGTIFLALVGEVTARGLTVDELRIAISQKYKQFVAETRYGELLKEGDDIEIRFVYDADLNLAPRVRSDGKISLPVVGDVQAAGLTPAEFRDQLVKKYSKHIKDPDVTVLVGPQTTRKIFADERYVSVAVSNPVSRAVFVGGEVLTPRAIQFGGHFTALQAIMQAGGVKETGDLARVVILRRGQFEEGEWIRTNLSNPLSGKSLENDLALHDGDVVVVPMSGIAQVNLWIKQYIQNVLPLQSQFNATYRIDRGSSN